MALLHVEGVTKTYATQTAVDAISFDIDKGSIFGLLGPNGAGKTTLIRMITGIFYPDQGRILLDGRPFDSEEDSKQIGYMPEERGLYKKMKIGPQAVYLAQLKGLSKAEATDKVRYWFERLEMQTWWNKKIEDLSKGMGQKLQFVTTVLHEPRLIILDEPFSGLDPVNANLIKDEIYQLARNGSTIIFSTHRMEQVEEICDQIILVNKGRKILDGTVPGVKQQFKENLFRVGLEDTSPFGSGSTRTPLHPAGVPPSSAPGAPFGTDIASAGPSDGPFELVSSRPDHLIIRIPAGSRPNDILSWFIGRGHNITSFAEILPSLNDIFIRLVEGTPVSRQFQTTNN